jgi:hypothetical protein
MKLLAPLLLILSNLPASATPPNAQFNSSKSFNGPDRTITWGPWRQNANDDFRFRIGDRHLGRAVWEHYLGFEQDRSSSKATKLSMIRLGNKDVWRGSRHPTGVSLMQFKGNQRHHDGSQRRIELDRAGGPVRVSRSKISAGDTSTFPQTKNCTVKKRKAKSDPLSWINNLPVR